MITSISIENYALIEKLSVDFTDGFSVITGETGAGKSILLGALGLVLGNRADLSSLKNKDEKCIIEAHFSISKYNLKPFFEANDLDYEEDTIIRREILPTGKSRAFINDTPVNLSELQELSDVLLDIHSQHQTQELSETKMQFQIIDAVATNQDNLESYTALLKEYKQSLAVLNQKKATLAELTKEQEYNSFLLEELLAAQLEQCNQQELESSLEKLNNVEHIKESLVRSLAVANDEQFGVLQYLREIKVNIQKIAGFSEEYEAILQRISSVIIEFDDIEKELQSQSESLYGDPEKMEQITQKLQLIYALQKKHQVQTIEELLVIQNDLDEKVISVSSLEIEIEKTAALLLDLESKLNALSDSIHENRAVAIPVLTQKMEAILALLGMENARFSIQINVGEQFLSNGKDEIQFLFAANKGSDFGLLKKVASGGEMSRIMLAVKAILSKYSNLPTIIFDEIDTGVSGEIANKMAQIMKNMSETMQVFAITHLPQIAGKGTVHFKVYKKVEQEQTKSELKLLTNEERINEIAQMLSGIDVTASAIIHAKELLN
jgi:DNA repair protein RecN (Recombination protein N)